MPYSIGKFPIETKTFLPRQAIKSPAMLQLNSSVSPYTLA